MQSDSADLLGGFRPVQLRTLAHPLLTTTLHLFPKLFSKTVRRSPVRCVRANFFFPDAKWAVRLVPSVSHGCVGGVVADSGQRGVSSRIAKSFQHTAVERVWERAWEPDHHGASQAQHVRFLRRIAFVWRCLAIWTRRFL